MSDVDIFVSDVDIFVSDVDICVSDVDICHVKCRKVAGEPV